MLKFILHVKGNRNVATFYFFILGGFDNNFRENMEYLDELKRLVERKGVTDLIRFIMSCSTAERNALLAQCLCVLYTPKVCPILLSLRRRKANSLSLESDL